MNFRQHMESLRLLSCDYYQNRLTFSEYREKRKYLLIMIDEELNGVKCDLENQGKNNKVDESLINKAISFLKIDKFKELN